MPLHQVVLSFAVIILVIFAAYYGTYLFGMKSQGLSRGRNRNINLVDRFSISKDKSFCIIEIAGQIYIVGVTNQSMTLLDKLDSAAAAALAAERGGADFRAGRQGGAAGYDNTLVSYIASMIKRKTARGSFKSAMSKAADRDADRDVEKAAEKATEKATDEAADKSGVKSQSDSEKTLDRPEGDE